MSEQKMGISGRIAAAFQRAQITPLLALVAFLLGVFAVMVTPREEEPQINVTMANVIAPFPGASVRDVEQMVAIPAEQVLSKIAGVEHVYSVSRPGVAILTVQFKVGVPRTEALVKLHDTIRENADWLPRNLGLPEPLIKPKGIDDVPIVSLTLHGKNADVSAFDLERVAHSIEADIKRVPGTRDVVTIGGPRRAVLVQIDPQRMNGSGVTVHDLRMALQSANLGLPVGELLGANQSVAIEAGPHLAQASDVADLVVQVVQGKPVFLKDVASVKDGPMPAERYVWHGNNDKNGGEEFAAVTLSITKKSGENAIDVANGVKSRVEKLQGTVIPDNVQVVETRNYGGRNRKLLGLGIAGLIALSLVLPVTGLVMLKMLPFDDKSEFQVVVDMSAGTPLERTAAVMRELGGHLATVPEVTHYQAYVGTASPINFNGLVRQYYLRAGSELGDLQVNLVRKSERSDKSHVIATRVRPALQEIGRKHGANVKVVEVPPGPPVMSPIVAEIYGPDAEGRRQVAKSVRAVFEKTEGVVDIDDSSIDDAPRKLLLVDRRKAAVLGVSQQAIVTTLRAGLAGESVTYLHDGSKYPVPACQSTLGASPVAPGGEASAAHGSAWSYTANQARGPSAAVQHRTHLGGRVGAQHLAWHAKLAAQAWRIRLQGLGEQNRQHAGPCGPTLPGTCAKAKVARIATLRQPLQRTPLATRLAT
eukprot:gene27617-34364_t